VGTQVSFNKPAGLAVDASNNVYVGDYSSQRVRKIVAGNAVVSNCAASSYGPVGGDANTMCSTCPAGFFCPRGAVVPTSCWVGFYCPANASFPQVCPTGAACGSMGMANSTLCGEGTYAPTLGLMQCLVTPLGSYGPIMGLSSAMVCPVGSFCNSTGMTTATPCPVGSVCPSLGLNASMLCPSGSSCFNMGMNASTLCFTGSYSPTVGLSSCLSCPVGAVCPVVGLSAFVPCPAGSACASGGLSVAAPCSAGSHAPTAGHSSCVPCPAGSACNTTGLSVAAPCSTGTYTPSTGFVSCVACPTGQYCPSFGMTAGLACQDGYYCPTAGLSAPLPCGPTQCLIPGVTATTFHVTATDVTQPLRVYVTFNESVRANPSASLVVNISNTVVASVWTWTRSTVAVTAIPQVQPVSAFNASALGCTAYSVANHQSDWTLLPRSPSTSFGRVLSANDVAVDTVGLRTCNQAPTAMPSASATLYNDTVLVLDIPAPLFQWNTPYQLTIPADAFCWTSGMTKCSASYSFTFNLGADPWDAVAMVDVTASGSSPITLQMTNNPTWNTSTYQISPVASSVRMSFAATIPTTGGFVGFAMPVDASTLRNMLPLSAALSVGSSMWKTTTMNVPATQFQDRLVLHSDLSLASAQLPVRWLSACQRNASNPASTIQCTLPTLATGTFWRLYLCLSVPFADGMVIGRPCRALPLFGTADAPLTLTFPLPSLLPGTARRFPIDAQGTRSVSMPFLYTPPEVRCSFC
jgi:hypothetical protein